MPKGGRDVLHAGLTASIAIIDEHMLLFSENAIENIMIFHLMNRPLSWKHHYLCIQEQALRRYRIQILNTPRDLRLVPRRRVITKVLMTVGAPIAGDFLHQSFDL